MRAGWGQPSMKKRSHYFRNGQAVCGSNRFAAPFHDYEEGPIGEVACANDCKACWKVIQKERAAARERQEKGAQKLHARLDDLSDAVRALREGDDGMAEWAIVALLHDRTKIAKKTVALLLDEAANLSALVYGED